eukprot:TRINITY_DN9433_c0_g1_i1.p1 TRINITY_DN9433_c0_g1~~TRINITY_DN9433_c0_g1_i1.p1  ORF type:complete len:357 (-),score=103.52 TRINITY_DN9433_c0_g1_i1:89-1159(-)
MSAPSIQLPGGFFTFNMDDGFLEALLRGFKLGLLNQTEYTNLCQCENLEDLKLQLAATSYGDFLDSEVGPLTTATIAEKCTLKMVEHFNYLRTNSVKPLSTFLDYITYGYMIDNVVLLITGTLHERNPDELREKCHPLGLFPTMSTITVEHSVAGLYNEVLIDTPLGPYIQGCLEEKDLDEMNIEIIRNTLYKAYLEDFYNYCLSLGGPTADVMHDVLSFEADRRSINITLNSFGTELSKDDRARLYPRFGSLYPEGTEMLKKSDDAEQVRASLETFATYRNLLSDIQYSEDKGLEEAFFEYEVQLNKLSFMQQFGYGVFYSYFKLKEQEIRNIVWIAECIVQGQKAKMSQYIPIF